MAAKQNSVQNSNRHRKDRQRERLMLMEEGKRSGRRKKKWMEKILKALVGTLFLFAIKYLTGGFTDHMEMISLTVSL